MVHMTKWVFFALIFAVYPAFAQPVTGVWRGKITMGSGLRQSSATLEVKLIAKGDSLIGATYYYGSGKDFIRYSIRGYFDLLDGSVHWEDFHLVEKVSQKTRDLRTYSETMKFRADYSCPDGKTLLLNGFCSLPGDAEMRVDLRKVDKTFFPDEWDEVISGYFTGMNRKEVLDSVWLIASVPAPAKAPADMAGSSVARADPVNTRVDTIRTLPGGVTTVVPIVLPPVSVSSGATVPVAAEAAKSNVAVATPGSKAVGTAVSGTEKPGITPAGTKGNTKDTAGAVAVVAAPEKPKPRAPVDITADIAKANAYKAEPATPTQTATSTQANPPPPQKPSISPAALLAQPLPNPSVQMKEEFNLRKKIVQTEIPVYGDTLEIRFYDNAEVDGDSISLFLNGVALFQHIRLESKAYIFKIPVKDLPRENDLTMFAENLGAIPPNTAYMEAIVQGQRYSARIESTEKTSGVIKLIRKE